MFSHVLTLKGTEKSGTFCEPYSVCASSTKDTKSKNPHSSLYVSDITKNRLVKINHKSTQLQFTKNKKQQNRETEWSCTALNTPGNLLNVPRCVVAVPHSHKKHGYFRSSPKNDVILVVDSGHNRIRALSVVESIEQQGGEAEVPWINIAGCGTKGYRDGSGFKAMFNHPHAACFLMDGSVLVSDTLNHRIRRLYPNEKKVQKSTMKKKVEEEGEDGVDRMIFSPAARTSSAKRHADRTSAVSQQTNKTPSLSAMLLQWSVGERDEKKNHPVHSMRAGILVSTVAGGPRGGLCNGLESLLRQPKGMVLCEDSGVVVLCDSG